MSAARSRWFDAWYRLGLILSILAPLWLCAFGLFIGLRNFCEEACPQPAVHPHDHWPAWVGSAVCVGLIWGGTWVADDWRHRERPIEGTDVWLARVSPIIFVTALPGCGYAVLVQDTYATPGYGHWAYTGGTVWLWLVPTLLGIALLARSFWALRPEWGPMGVPAVVALLTALVIGTGYVVWPG